MRHIRVGIHDELRIRIDTIEEFITMMSRSGYNNGQIQEIVTRGLKGYQKQVNKAERDGRLSIHRRGWTTRGARQIKKALGKTTWYKRKRTEDEEDDDRTNSMSPKKRRKIANKIADNNFEDPMSLLFVERTEGGTLASKLRELEPTLSKMTQGRVKVVEKNGRKLGEMLIK